MRLGLLLISGLALLALGSSADARGGGGGGHSGGGHGGGRGYGGVAEGRTFHPHINSPVKLVTPDPRYRPRPETPPEKISRVLAEHRLVRAQWHPPRQRPNRIARALARHHHVRLRNHL